MERITRVPRILLAYRFESRVSNLTAQALCLAHRTRLSQEMGVTLKTVLPTDRI